MEPTPTSNWRIWCKAHGLGSEPVFNLKVMLAHSFFVGRRGMLAHDNSLIEPVLEPFDAVPDLASILAQPTQSRERPKIHIALSTVQ